MINDFFNKKLLADNITYLAKSKKENISDIETKIGVSVGYLARLKQPEKYALNPGIELIVKASNLFDCSIETLLFCDLSILTDTEAYINRFIDRLIVDTSSSKIQWDKIKLIDYFTSSMNAGNNSLIEDYGDATAYDFVFRSNFDDVDDVLDISGNIYCLERASQSFYLFKLQSRETMSDYERYELYLRKDGSTNKICYGCSDKEQKLFSVLKALYRLAINSSNQIKIDKKVKDGIDAYFSGEDDKLPF